jgi:hypothetical protein
MHARGPPRKVSICPHTPGRLFEIGIFASHRSGLHVISTPNISFNCAGKELEDTHMNSPASAPQISLSQFIAPIGIILFSSFVN